MITDYEKSDVISVLTKCGDTTKLTQQLSLEDFAVLLSPASDSYLEEITRLAREKTIKRFGKTIQLYIPLYLSNICTNICTYCGYSFGNKLPRITLNDTQIGAEVAAIKEMGYDSLLVLSGEAQREVGLPYFLNALKILRPHFSQITFEVQPLEVDEYVALKESGVSGVLAYQETYDKDRYQAVHLKGKKADFDYRLDTPNRIGAAKIRKIGLGVLLGLADWRQDSLAMAAHLRALQKKHWQSRFSISFPRIRPAAGVTAPPTLINDTDLVKLISAWRLFDETLELSLSTRESAALRDLLITVGITSTSADSKTEPGGYAVNTNALQQFEICDTRSTQEVVAAIRASGREVVWRDWLPEFI